MQRTALALVLLVVSVVTFTAQQPTAPQFEVASVKPSNPNPSGPLGSIPLIMPPVGGRFTATNVPLRLLVRAAFALQDFQIVGGPSWQMERRFDIVAKTEDAAANMETVLPMLKALLADRFQLETHTETREMSVSALVVARNDGTLGPDLKASTADCANQADQAQKLAEAFAKGGPAAAAALLPRNGQPIPCAVGPLMPTAGAGAISFGLRGNGVPLSSLTRLLTEFTGRLVNDKTGLTGLYDWELRFDPEVMMQLALRSGVNLPPGISLPQSDSPSLLTALREQLGLKLDSERGPVEVIVIDSAELPAPD